MSDIALAQIAGQLNQALRGFGIAEGQPLTPDWSAW